MRPASEKGHKIVSHREQSCSVQKKRSRLHRLWHLFISFYHVLFFFCWWVSLGKSPVAVALSVQLHFCVHILFFNNCTYVKVKRENTQANSIFSAV